MTTITRLYESQDRAAAAAKELLENDDFPEHSVQVIADAGSSGSVEAALTKAGVYAAAARTYAEHVAKGEALIVVQAPFGCTQAAKSILDKHGPIAADVKHTVVHKGTSSSSKLINNKYLPVLVPRDTLIFSGSLARSLSKKSRPRAGLTEMATPLSSSLGMPLLKNKPPKAKLAKSATPLSSMLGLPTLSQKKPRSSRPAS